MDEAELKKAKFYGLRVINFRPRSSEELITKLKDKGYAEDIITEVILEFEKKGLLNDTKFSRLWIESRMARRPKGASVLRQELKAKGVKEEVIDKALDSLKNNYSEYEVVKNLADSRMPALEGLDKTTAKRRLVGYLQRRGFDFDTIMKVVEEEFKNQ